MSSPRLLGTFKASSIERKAWEIKKLVGDAKVSIAHGQMTKSELEKAMIEFVTGQTDVLVCTTIIESGLDIPNANTIFINDADRFGLMEHLQGKGIRTPWPGMRGADETPRYRR